MLMGANKTLQEQVSILHEIIKLDDELYSILVRLSKLDLPNYYMGAGCITQSVWNSLYSCEIGYGISDVDIVYFDSDLSMEKESCIIEHLTKELPNTRYALDIKNQARVHLWYEEKFGFPTVAYKSTEEAINTWPSTATSIGVKLENGALKVYAPYGMNDMFNGIIRANKTLITKEIHDQKSKKWYNKWQGLTVIKW